MPAALKRAHLHTLLYAARSMANASGELRFHGDRKPMRIRDIARAAGADEKDTRDRLEAARLAGVLGVVGERKRGRSALYVLVLAPAPDWSAAVAHLEGAKALREEARQRREAERRAAPWVEENGGRTPELEGPENGGPPPELRGPEQKSERGTAPRMSSGDRPPNGSGDRPPNNPGRTQDLTQDGAEVLPQPQVVGPPGEQNEAQDTPRADPADGFTRCARCGDPMLPRYGRTTHAHCQPLTTAERTSA
ncbi:hypothetical protein AB0N17_03245 [Streptomyces sp. NPDC051133]|uniref:hypothetical protein n=1 Tax=Streptomyces sp. NPDC051133 TaxID=3155521 RepID=UPI00342CB13C